jgi:hypothetical protein
MNDLLRPNRFGGIHSLAHESREHKNEDKRSSKSKLSWMETMKQDRASTVAAAAGRLFARRLIG